MMESGTKVNALNLNRKFIGFEKDLKIFNIVKIKINARSK